MYTGKIFATMMRHSLYFDMQHDHILKKFNFGLRPTPLVYPGRQIQAFELKSCLIAFISIVPLSACKDYIKNVDS